MRAPIFWNPINLLDAEARWIGIEILVLLGAFIVSKIFLILLRGLDRRAQSPYLKAFAESVYAPSITLLWFFIALFSFDLVTEGFLRGINLKTLSSILNGGTILVLGWFLLRFKNRLFEIMSKAQQQADPLHPNGTSLLAVSKLLSVAIVIFIAMLFHDVTGVSFTTLLAFGGVGGLALAFASQEIFSNFFGGLMVHITRPFIVGEIITMPAHNIDGVIEEIGWYQTLIRANSKTAVYIPNSLFSKALLINKSRITHRLVDDIISFSIYPVANVATIIEDLNKYILSHPLIDKEEWAGARIDSFDGPICKLVITAPLKVTSLSEHYTHHDEILLHAVEIISSHGGILSSVPHLSF